MSLNHAEGTPKVELKDEAESFTNLTKASSHRAETETPKCL